MGGVPGVSGSAEEYREDPSIIGLITGPRASRAELDERPTRIYVAWLTRACSRACANARAITRDYPPSGVNDSKGSLC